MKNTRGEREGGRRPPLANCRKCNYDLNRSVTQRASRQKRSSIGGHSSRPKDGQTSGHCTEGKPPCGLGATQSGSRKKRRGGATAASAGGLYPSRGGRRAPDNRSPRKGVMAQRRDRLQEPDKGNADEGREQPRQPKSDDETPKRFCKGMLRTQSYEKHSGGEPGPRTQLHAVAPFRGEAGPLATP